MKAMLLELKTMFDNQFNIHAIKMPEKLFRRRDIEFRGFCTKSENKIRGFHKDEF